MAEGGGGGKTVMIVLVVLAFLGLCVCGGGGVAVYYFYVEAQRGVAEFERALAEAEAEAMREAAEAAEAERREAIMAENGEVTEPDVGDSSEKSVRALAPDADEATLAETARVVGSRLEIAGIPAYVDGADGRIVATVDEASYFDAMGLMAVRGRLRLQLVVTSIELPEEEIEAAIDQVRRRQQSGEWDAATDEHDVALSRQGPLLLESPGLDSPNVDGGRAEGEVTVLELGDAARARFAELTVDAGGRKLAIRFDDLVVATVDLEAAIEDGVLRIAVGDEDEAKKIAVLAQSGPLPVALTIEDD